MIYPSHPGFCSRNHRRCGRAQLLPVVHPFPHTPVSLMAWWVVFLVPSVAVACLHSCIGSLMQRVTVSSSSTSVRLSNRVMRATMHVPCNRLPSFSCAKSPSPVYAPPPSTDNIASSTGFLMNCLMFSCGCWSCLLCQASTDAGGCGAKECVGDYCAKYTRFLPSALQLRSSTISRPTRCPRRPTEQSSSLRRNNRLWDRPPC